MVDTSLYEYVGLTSISALNAEDSTLVSFTRCDEDGYFQLDIKGPGDYIFLYSHRTYAQFVDQRTITGDTDLGVVYMIPKSVLLEEYIVEEKRAITIKGDTVEYNADSFNVREFDNVEELLKRLPGLEVDASGNITAHGEKVQKMLVDGDEFFSDDPIVLSKMLRASSVKTVQVFDDKSEQAKFTGVDDGTKEKTINLQLKDDAKSGLFGKVEAGGGLPDYWENAAILNTFRDKRKISVFGVMSNTNKTGLGWEDMRNMGGGSMEMSDDGGIVTTMSAASDDFSGWDGRFSGDGLPKTWNGGAHYSNKWGEDNKHELNTDYRFNKNNVNINKSSATQYYFVDNEYIGTNSTDQFSSNISNSVNTRYRMKIDSTSNLQVRADANHRLFQNRQSTRSDNSRFTGEMISDNRSETDREGYSYGANTDILYRKKFMKKGRSMSANLTLGLANNIAETDFLSTRNSYMTGTSQVYDQYKTDSVRSHNGRINLTYTEPLIEDRLFLVNSAIYSNNTRKNSNFAFDRTGGGLVVNDTFTNSFDYRVNFISAGTALNYQNDKFNASAGGNISYTDFYQMNLRTDSLLSFNAVNFNPRISFNTKGNRNFDLRLNYNGNTRQPDINQLQPIRQNADPLNISEGNLDLKQEFRHNLNFNVGNYKVLQQRWLYAGGGINYIANAISTDQNFRPDGVRVYSYYNAPGNWNAYLYSGYSFKPKNWKPRLNFNLNASYSRMLSRLNGIESANENISLTPSVGFDYALDTLLFVDYTISGGYNIANSQNTMINNNFFTSTQRLDISYRFPADITVGMDINWLLREKVNEYDNNNNVFLWNAYAQKAFLQDKSLVLKLYLNDALNQNVRFQRNVYENTVHESFANSIRRYGMLSLTWNFTKSKALAGKSDGVDSESLAPEADTNPDSYIEITE